MENHANHTILLTLLTAISAGIALIALSRKTGVPAIILLLLSGFALGPEGAGFVRADSLGPVFPVFVSLAVGIILFEGGLSLDVEGYRDASNVIRRLLSWGVLITWLGTSVTIHFLVGFPFSFSLLAASLVIVTGPTVIAPLLKMIRIKPRVHGILSWESVLIDPIGVFVAVLCFDWITTANAEAALGQFALRVACGVAVGIIGGELLNVVLSRRLVPDDMVSVSVLSGALLIFGTAELILDEAGLLAALTGGMLLGFRRPDELRRIRHFKAEITELMLGTLFILLASRLEVKQFAELGWRGALAVAVVLFLIRPLNALVCSLRTDLSWRERLFIGWIAPRGIVAASMASLFSLSLQREAGGELPEPSNLTDVLNLVPAPLGAGPAVFLETFTYAVIISTIVLHGLTIYPVARFLRLAEPPATGWLVVGAHRFGREVAKFLAENGAAVFLVDSDRELVRRAAAEGFDAATGDARNCARLSRISAVRIANVIALTDNEELNILVCQCWAGIAGKTHVYRWNSGRGEELVERESRGQVVWEELPKPGELSREIEEGQSVVLRDHKGVFQPDESLVFLAGSREKQVFFNLAEFEKAATQEGAPASVLYLKRGAAG